MPDIIIYGIIVIVVAVILWLLLTKVLKNKKVSNSTVKVSIDIHRLIEALGGIQNIEGMEATNSKASFVVKDAASINVKVIKELGATGVVQSNQKVTAIFGKASKSIVEAIKSN